MKNKILMCGATLLIALALFGCSGGGGSDSGSGNSPATPETKIAVSNASSGGDVIIKWQPVSGADSYEVLKNSVWLTGGNNWTQTMLDDHTNNGKNTVDYTVIANKGQEEIGRGDIIIQGTQPSTVGVQANSWQGYFEKYQITWNDGKQLAVTKTNIIVNGTLVSTIPMNQGSSYVATLNTNATNTILVQEIDSSNTIIWSGNTSVTLGDYPCDFSTSSNNGNSLTISDTNPYIGNNNYEVKITKDGNSVGDINYNSLSSGTLNDSGLQPSTTYNYTATIIDKFYGNTVETFTFTGKTAQLMTLTAIKNASCGGFLHWTPVPGAAYYTLSAPQDPVDGVMIMNSKKENYDEANTTGYCQFPNMERGHLDITVNAYDSNGNLINSAFLSYNNPPPLPTPIETGATSTTISLQWQKDNTSDSTSVFERNGMYWYGITNLPQSATAGTFTQLNSNTKYEFTVRSDSVTPIGDIVFNTSDSVYFTTTN